VSGKDVLEEDVRQLCIHELTRVPRSQKRGLSAQGPIVFYAEKWWNYVEKLPEHCPVDSQEPERRFGKDCSEKLMEEIGIDVNRVRHCVDTTFDQKLESELVNKAWSPRALRVNGWRYKGMLEADLVTRAVCSGFIQAPEECNVLLQPRSPFEKYTGKASSSGVSATFLLAATFALLTISCCTLRLYRRFLEKKIALQIREQVMLEVSDQMLNYNQLEELC
jgi:hypothetical protein